MRKHQRQQRGDKRAIDAAVHMRLLLPMLQRSAARCCRASARMFEPAMRIRQPNRERSRAAALYTRQNRICHARSVILWSAVDAQRRRRHLMARTLRATRRYDIVRH